MASRRILKKDINYLTSELISDCFAYMSIHPENNKEKVMQLIKQAVNLRNELVSKVNHIKLEKDAKKLKPIFTSIKSDMFKNIDQSFESLSKLIK